MRLFVQSQQLARISGTRHLDLVPLPQLSLAVVGADFPNSKGPTRRFEIALCRPGEPVALRPEPENKFDRRAVAVYSARGIQLGYITAERCGRIGQLIRSGRAMTSVFQEQTTFGAVIRVAFDGDDPALPPVGPADSGQQSDPEPEWHRDEDWPD